MPKDKRSLLQETKFKDEKEKMYKDAWEQYCKELFKTHFGSEPC